MNQIAKTISTLSLFLVLCVLPAIAQSDVGASSKEQAAKVNVAVDGQSVRFTAQEDGAARRLVVTNQQGEAIFDSGFTSGNILEWSPKGPQGNAIASGLYNYTLTTRMQPNASPIIEQGQVIVDRAGSQDRMLLASGSQSGAGADGRVLKVTIIDDRESRGTATASQARQASGRTTAVESNVQITSQRSARATTEAFDTATFAASNKIGIGIDANTDPLAVEGLELVGTGGTYKQLAAHNERSVGAEFYTHEDASFRGPVLGLFKSRGSQAAPTLVQASNNLGYINFGGYNSAAYVTGASIWSQAGSVDWSGTQNSADLQFYVTNTGTQIPTRALYIAPSAKVSIHSGVVIGYGEGGVTTSAPTNGAIIQGNVGIGTTSPSTFKLQVAGSVGPNVDNDGSLGGSMNRWQTVYAVNGTIQTSDARFKKGMTNLNYGLREVMQLRPISFQWKDSSDTNQQIGLVAQEVEKIIPEVVQRDANPAAPLGMNYGNLVPVMIKAVQEQQATITTLKNENAELKQQNAALEARLSALEKKLEQK